MTSNVPLTQSEATSGRTSPSPTRTCLDSGRVRAF